MAAPSGLGDEELVRRINQALARSGERDRLKQLIRTKLQQAGWFDKVKAECEKEVRSRSVESLSPQELTSVMVVRATQLMPAHVHAELLEEIKRFLEAHLTLS